MQKQSYTLSKDQLDTFYSLFHLAAHANPHAYDNGVGAPDGIDQGGMQAAQLLDEVITVFHQLGCDVNTYTYGELHATR